MAKTKKQERKRIKYTEKDLKKAICKINTGESIRKLSRECGILKTTLLDKKENQYLQ